MKRTLFFLLILLPALAKSQTDYQQEIAAFRQHYKEEFLQDERSPLQAADTAMLAFFPPDSTWRVQARFVATPDAKAFNLPTYSGQTRPYRQYGTLFFTKNGAEYSLNVYQNLRLVANPEYQNHLFLPFNDLSNGDVTYGGGRYIDLKSTDINPETNILTIDFNHCYNPWCAYSDGYSCPIPPKENNLDIFVDAGEQMFGGAHK